MLRLAAAARLLVGVPLAPWLAAGQTPQPDGAERAIAIPLELQAVRRTPVPLNGDEVLALHPGTGERTRVRVVLEQTVYRGKMLQVVRGTRVESAAPEFCYELRSTRTDVPYSWALWSPCPLGWFRLFTTAGGENYLAWVEASAVEFVEVSKARDRCVALAEHYAKRPFAPVEVVPVHRLVPGVRRWGVNALYSDIMVRSIDKNDHGNWVVKISPPDSDELFTLVGKGESWHRD